jgi:hypothetical protein
MNPVFVIVLTFGLVVGCTAGTGYLAERKGRSFLGWAAVGFIFGIFGLIVAACLPKKKPAF